MTLESDEVYSTEEEDAAPEEVTTRNTQRNLPLKSQASLKEKLLLKEKRRAHNQQQLNQKYTKLSLKQLKESNVVKEDVKVLQPQHKPKPPRQNKKTIFKKG